MIVGICLGFIIGILIGFFLGLDLADTRQPWPAAMPRPEKAPFPRLVGRDPDRILRTVFTPRDYSPGPGWIYYPELKEWHRET